MKIYVASRHIYVNNFEKLPASPDWPRTGISFPSFNSAFEEAAQPPWQPRNPAIMQSAGRTFSIEFSSLEVMLQLCLQNSSTVFRMHHVEKENDSVYF